MARSGKWYKLDNVATIVPSSVSGADTRTFRLACELKDNIDPDLLQEALDHTIPDFPYLQSVLRKGFFWYYLDFRNVRPIAEEETSSPCAPLFFDGRKNLLFRVLYFRKRINLEMFHVLSDGTGAFVFFRALVLSYLSLRYQLHFEPDDETRATESQKSNDAYRQYYRRQKGLSQFKSMTSKKAYHLKGEPDEYDLPHFMEATVSAEKVRALAKKYQVSVGELTVSLYIAAVLDEMGNEDRERPVVISVPVNLRKYFPSETTRNFFGVINISYPAEEFDGTMESILSKVKNSFGEQLKPEQISKVMNSYEELEHNIGVKMIPLFIKDIVTHRLNHLAAQGVTGTLSNLGLLHVPENAEAHIEKFAAFMPAPSEQICVVTFGDRMVFGEASPYTKHESMLHFLRRLSDMGIPAELSVNDYEEE